MSGPQQREFAARMEALAEAVTFVEAFGASHAIARDDVLRLALFVEELFTNTVMHGHGGDSEHRVAIALGAEPHGLRLVYEDQAPPFDPLAAHDADAAIEAPADERPVGGLGVHLVTHMASRVDYERVQGRNRLTIELARRG